MDNMAYVRQALKNLAIILPSMLLGSKIAHVFYEGQRQRVLTDDQR